MSHVRTELDYYVLLPRTGGSTWGGVVVEEFVRDADHSSVGLCGLVWTPDEARWRSSASFSRAMRTEQELLARVTVVDRRGAEAAYRELGGGALPAEDELRTGFLDQVPLASAPPLRLGPAEPPEGFHQKRVYRVLFAPPAAGRPAFDGGEPASGGRRVGGDLFTWHLRRIGAGIGWGLDVTVLLATGVDDAVGPVLRDVTAAVRRQGLIPVTTERFA